MALMEIQASRARRARRPDGEPILLLDQNRARWDQLLIRRGLAALDRAESSTRHRRRAQRPYALQAAIAACHARARVAARHRLARASPRSTRRSLERRAVAGGRAQPRGRGRRWRSGPQAGLALVDALDCRSRRSSGYHLLPSVRGDLLVKLGRRDEARAEFERAASLTATRASATLLLERARAAAGVVNLILLRPGAAPRRDARSSAGAGAARDRRLARHPGQDIPSRHHRRPARLRAG